MYPKLGPGQLWEYVAETVQKKGGCVRPAGMWRRFTPMATRSNRWRPCTPKRANGAPLRRIISFPPCPSRNSCTLSTRRFQQRPAGQRRVDVPRLHHRRPAPEKGCRSVTIPLPERSCLPTTGSIFRNPTCWSDGCRSSTTGALIWWPIPAWSGWAWSISATTRTTSGRSPTRT
jgi:hypothetical protein